MKQHVLLHLEVPEMRACAIYRKSETTLFKKRKKILLIGMCWRIDSAQYCHTLKPFS